VSLAEVWCSSSTFAGFAGVLVWWSVGESLWDGQAFEGSGGAAKMGENDSGLTNGPAYQDGNYCSDESQGGTDDFTPALLQLKQILHRGHR
jgi:hypothetical protein